MGDISCDDEGSNNGNNWQSHLLIKCNSIVNAMTPISGDGNEQPTQH